LDTEGIVATEATLKNLPISREVQQFSLSLFNREAVQEKVVLKINATQYY